MSQDIELLLIEDEPKFAEMVVVLLGAEPLFHVRHAAHLAEGLRVLDDHPCDVVLLDLSLPDSDGLATLDAVQKHAPDKPVVILTGSEDESLAIEAVKRGAQDYLFKTEIRCRSLIRGIHAAIERHHLKTELRTKARLLEERNAQMEAELRLARTLQLSYLPRQRIAFPSAVDPSNAPLRFCFRYDPADELGGDFFDVLELSNHEAGVFICDVMGHGVAAALVSATMRGLIEEMKSKATNVSDFMTELNRALCAILRQTDPPMFVTAFYLVADIARSEVRYANAGHPAPFYIHPAGELVQPLCTRPSGPALGMFESARFPVHNRSVTPGDRFVLFTDGLYEVEGPSAEPYGRERLPDDIRQRLGLPQSRMFDELLNHIRAFSHEQQFADDVCLVGIEVGIGETKTGNGESE